MNAERGNEMKDENVIVEKSKALALKNRQLKNNQ